VGVALEGGGLLVDLLKAVGERLQVRLDDEAGLALGHVLADAAHVAGDHPAAAGGGLAGDQAVAFRPGGRREQDVDLPVQVDDAGLRHAPDEGDRHLPPMGLQAVALVLGVVDDEHFQVFRLHGFNGGLQQEVAFVFGHAADMPADDLVGVAGVLGFPRQGLGDAVFVDADQRDVVFPVDVGEAVGGGQHGLGAAQQTLEMEDALDRLQLADIVGQGARQVRVGVAVRVDGVVGVDEELVVGYPPGVVDGDEVRDACGAGGLDHGGGQALDAVEVHEVGLFGLQVVAEQFAHPRVGGVPVHVFPPQDGGAVDARALVVVGGHLVRRLQVGVGGEDADFEAVAVVALQQVEVVGDDAGRAADGLRREEDVDQGDFFARLAAGPSGGVEGVGQQRGEVAGQRPDAVFGADAGLGVVGDGLAQRGVVGQAFEVPVPVVAGGGDEAVFAVVDDVAVVGGGADHGRYPQAGGLEPFQFALAAVDPVVVQDGEVDVGAFEHGPVGLDAFDRRHLFDAVAIGGEEGFRQFQVAGDPQADFGVFVEQAADGGQGQVGKVAVVGHGAAAVEDVDGGLAGVMGLVFEHVQGVKAVAVEVAAPAEHQGLELVGQGLGGGQPEAAAVRGGVEGGHAFHELEVGLQAQVAAVGFDGRRVGGVEQQVVDLVDRQPPGGVDLGHGFQDHRFGGDAVEDDDVVEGQGVLLLGQVGPGHGGDGLADGFQLLDFLVDAVAHALRDMVVADDEDAPQVAAADVGGVGRRPVKAQVRAVNELGSGGHLTDQSIAVIGNGKSFKSTLLFHPIVVDKFIKAFTESRRFGIFFNGIQQHFQHYAGVYC